MTARFALLAGSLLGALGVGLGAFGAHALRSMLLATNRIDTFETAVKYQFYHALALVAVGILMQQFPEKNWSAAGWSFLVGTLIFSGSLYLICFTGIKVFGAITPIGGVALIAGWLLLAWQVSR
ncbi:DUF423 domain-containing protein [Siphonobacter aquaeclarae]|jgi:uncharacterized membrane protein YgdD (TMEM256/DUF423 family)|uniref:Uncharacterized membrane protein YgdD, TMEM256/DUF423 family n=1 Tax=Siphonobacter aquaeclarae TaxID=563176 RepID=A0A1G9NK94_9BACT|nr:DUF423 domain-containing protein [Siphonobacter aquaeclarae]MBO9637913.1 DUF423 domain-containing protein [Siphonobacter aquaeclarae]SDL86405.1 Uncharacterized membrane protein YgdD, TMEM256/DUF423 family [Siphonobacter aquaeclarae]